MLTEEYSPLAHFDAAAVLDALPCSVLVLDEALCLVYANAQAQALLGLNFSRIRGRPVHELLLAPTDLCNALLRALHTGAVASYRDVALCARPASSIGSAPTRVDMQVAPLDCDITGTHLVLQLARPAATVSEQPARAAIGGERRGRRRAHADGPVGGKVS